MKVFKHKKTAIALAICAAISGTALTTALTSAASNNANVSVNVSVKQSTKIVNWYKGAESDIVTDGYGKTGGKGMAMARIAAITDAQRNLLGIIKGVQIDSDTFMEDLIISSDIVKRKINGMLRGAQIIEEQEKDDDTYYVKMRVPLYGSTDSLASVVMPEIINNTKHEDFPQVTDELSETDIQHVKNAKYTGVIINANGLGMEPTFSPVIYDTEGRVVYGVQNLDYDAIIAEGMVGYADELADVSKGGRAGSKPLIIDAVEIKGGSNSNNKVNAVISVKDADKMLIANEANGILNKCAVVFVK